MGLRLTILSWWTPRWIIGRELDHVSNVTSAALKSLIAANAKDSNIQKSKTRQTETIEEKRVQMATEHATLVQALATAVGPDKAMGLGREALYEVGKSLGLETRSKLGVKNNPEDLIKAAKILYRVLGIDFNVEWSNETHATLVVDRCALAKQYSELTCKVLSATDEGVIKGLDTNATMEFKQLMTSGCPNCKAQIEITNPRQKK